MPDFGLLVSIGTGLIILGFLFIALGMMSSSLANEKKEQEGIHAQDITERSGLKVNGGGVIFIGPIPIVFGSDKRYAIIMILLAIVLMLLAMIFYSYMNDI